MTVLPQPVIDKLSKLLPRLASHHDGEVVATVCAIRRTLASSGHALSGKAIEVELQSLFNAVQAELTRMTIAGPRGERPGADAA